MNKFVLCLFLNIFILFLPDSVIPIKFHNNVSKVDIRENHGILVGYFTFTGKGVAGLKYFVSPFINSSNYKLSIFPMAYNAYSNLKRIKNYYSQATCKEFYHKAIFTVNLTKPEDQIALGRFSGGFAIAIVLYNKDVCPPNKKRIEIDENDSTKPIEVKLDILNPGEDNLFTDHLSASDQGVSQLLQVLLAMYSLMSLWAAYSIIFKSNVDIPLIIIIQKMACVIITIHISIYIILLVNYKNLSTYGTVNKEIELVAEFLAILCRYVELYVVVSWTLSSQRDSGNRCDIIARVIGFGAILHTAMTACHYCMIENWNMVHGCSVVWDCEPHIFTMGFGNPIRYYKSTFGFIVLVINWVAGLGGSLFVLHLLKLGLSALEFSVRRAYLSVFCTAALFWFWSHPVLWFISALITDYYQYKFILFTVNTVHLCAIPAILRVTILSPVQIEASLPISVAIYD